MKNEDDWSILKWFAVVVFWFVLLGALWGEAQGTEGTEPTLGITAMLVTADGEAAEVVVYAGPDDPAEYHLRAWKACQHVARQIELLPHVEGVRAWCVLDATLDPWWLNDVVEWDFVTEDVIIEIEIMKGEDQ